MPIHESPDLLVKNINCNNFYSIIIFHHAKVVCNNITLNVEINQLCGNNKTYGCDHCFMVKSFKATNLKLIQNSKP